MDGWQFDMLPNLLTVKGRRPSDEVIVSVQVLCNALDAGCSLEN